MRVWIISARIEQQASVFKCECLGSDLRGRQGALQINELRVSRPSVCQNYEI